MIKTINKKSDQTDKEWLENYCKNPENKARIIAKKIIMSLAVKIHQEREKRGLSQRDLAVKAGVPQSTIVRIEKGRGSNFLTISKVFGAMEIIPDIHFSNYTA